ncbi:unnamed protein product [Rhodiola kirilowii]
MTLDDSQSAVQQQPAEVDNQRPHSQTPNFTEIEDQLEEPQFPKTLTLDPQITQNPPGENNPAAFGVQEEDLEEAREEPEAQLDMSLASPTRAVTDTHVVVRLRATWSRRRQKRKRVNRKQLVAMQQKLQVLTAKLNLIPFVPNRTLDFPSHENLLRRLGLWDFVHVELDSSNLRVDLIAQLVVNYKRLGTGRVSEVNGVRIKLSRADLGRALKLPPVKKDNSSVVVVIDEDAELVSEVSIRFVEELMSNWMLMHGQDPWILPDEVMHWIEVIRRGHPDKVEWASLMWFMVEKELSQGLRLVDCYYASHLQHLIKHQNASLFLVEHAREEEEEEECAGDVEIVDEECVGTAVSEGCVVDEVVSSHGKECDAAVSEGCVDYKKAFKLSEESEAAVSEGCVDDKMAFTLNKESEAVVTEGCVDDKMAFTLHKESEAAVSEGYVDDKMDFTLNKESEAVVTDGCVDDKMAFTLHKESEAAVSEGYVDDKMDFTLNKASEAAGSKDCVDDKMPFTLTKESETAVSESYVDDKRTFTLNKESEATVSEGFVDDKMAFTPSKKSEAAVGEGCIDDKMAFTLSKESEAAVSDVDGKMDFTLSKESEAEKIRINVNEVCTDEKVIEESKGVKVSEPNNDTHVKELITHTETNEGDDFLDLHSGFPEGKSEEPSIELTLGQDNTETENTQPDDVMNFEDLGLGDTDNWQLNENIGEGEPFLRQCSLSEKSSFDIERRVEDNIIDDDAMDDDDEEEEVDADDDDEEEADDDANDEVEAGVDEETNLAEKFDSLHGIPSAHMYQAVDISQGAFGSPLSLLNESHMQQFVSHAETSSTPIGNKLKRAANRTVTGENKRFRSDTWDHQEPPNFDRCMENIEHWMGKAKMMYAEKEQQITQMSMNQQLLFAEMEQREHMIQHQERITNEVRQKSQMEIYKLEKELFEMVGVLDHYRKALKETRREFSEYRKQYTLPEEPIYKDAGPGGLVLSVAELERQRLKQEEEDKMKRLELEITVKSFEAEWYPVFERHSNDVQKLDEKLLLLEENVKLLKVLPLSPKAEETMEQPTMTED